MSIAQPCGQEHRIDNVVDVVVWKGIHAGLDTDRTRARGFILLPAETAALPGVDTRSDNNFVI